MLKKPLKVYCLHTINIISLLGLLVVWNLTDTSILSDLPIMLISGYANLINYDLMAPVLPLMFYALLGFLPKVETGSLSYMFPIAFEFLFLSAIVLATGVLLFGLMPAFLFFLVFLSIVSLRYTRSQLMLQSP